MARRRVNTEIELYEWKQNCDALNYLLGDIVKGGSPRRDREEYVFSLHLLGASHKHYQEHPPIPEQVRDHRLAVKAHTSLRKLERNTRLCCDELEPLLGLIEKEIEKDNSRQDLSNAYRHYTRVVSALRGFEKRLHNLDPTAAENASETAMEDLRDLAQAFRTLLALHDKPRLAQALRDSLRDHLERTPTHEEWQEWYRFRAPRDDLPKAYGALKRVNAYLDAQGANLTLAGQPGHLTKGTRDGKTPDALFTTYFSPFVDILTGDYRGVRIGVCANCGCVYVRRPHDNRGSTCDTRCKRERDARRRDRSSN